MTRIDATPPTPATVDREPQRLRAVAAQLEGVFVTEMFKAMRATVPDDGATGGAGEQIFTSMMDGHVAESVPQGWNRGIAAAILKQLGRRA